MRDDTEKRLHEGNRSYLHVFNMMVNLIIFVFTALLIAVLGSCCLKKHDH